MARRPRHHRARGRDPRLILALAALGLFALAVVLRWAGRMGGWWHGPDRALLLVLRDAVDPARPIGPAWLAETAVALTALGNWPVLLLATALAAGALVAAREWRRALWLVAAALSGRVLVDLLKQSIARERPVLVPHLVDVTSLSFPSAHAANAAIVLLGIATIATARASPALRRYVLVVAAALTLVIGATRVWLGVHWPSDVLAGWLFGFGWAMGWWAMAERSLR